MATPETHRTTPAEIAEEKNLEAHSQECQDARQNCSASLESLRQESLPSQETPNSQKKQNLINTFNKLRSNPNTSEFNQAYKEGIELLTQDIQKHKRTLLNKFNQENPQKSTKIFEEIIPHLSQEEKLHYTTITLKNSIFFQSENSTEDENLKQKLQQNLQKISASPEYNTNLSGSLFIMKAYSAFFNPDQSLDDVNVKDYGKKKAFYTPLYEEKTESRNRQKNGKESNEKMNVIYASPKNFAGILENVKPNTIIKMQPGKYEGPFISWTHNIILEPDKKAKVTITGKGEAYSQDAKIKNLGKNQGSALTLAGNNSEVRNITFNTPRTDCALQVRGAHSIVEDCKFDGIQTGILSLEEGITIQNCTFDKCHKDGIIVCGNNTSIKNNKFLEYIGDDQAHNDWIQIFKGDEKLITRDGRTTKDYFSGKDDQNPANYKKITGLLIEGNDLSSQKTNPERLAKLQGISGFWCKAEGIIRNNTIRVKSAHKISFPQSEKGKIKQENNNFI